MWILRQPLGIGQRHDRIISETAELSKEREIRPFDVVEFVGRAYDIPDDSSKHTPAYLNR